jgi:hypothetical protein
MFFKSYAYVGKDMHTNPSHKINIKQLRVSVRERHDLIKDGVQ